MRFRPPHALVRADGDRRIGCQSRNSQLRCGRERLLALVTQHGSRDLGAQVYRRGSEAAVRHTAKVSPETPPHQAWIGPGSDEGNTYWEALQ